MMHQIWLADNNMTYLLAVAIPMRGMTSHDVIISIDDVTYITTSTRMGVQHERIFGDVTSLSASISTFPAHVIHADKLRSYITRIRTGMYIDQRKTGRGNCCSAENVSPICQVCVCAAWELGEIPFSGARVFWLGLVSAPRSWMRIIAQHVTLCHSGIHKQLIRVQTIRSILHKHNTYTT